MDDEGSVETPPRRFTPKHQIIWKSKELNSSCKLHPDYARRVAGDWEMGGISIFDAILEEFKLINKMCKEINKPSLFKKDFIIFVCLFSL